MPLTVFSSPARYTQGDGATRRLGSELKAIGLDGPAFILASRTAARLLESTWAATLGSVGIESTVRVFGGECTQTEIGAATCEAHRFAAKVIVGAGGGKALDAARAVADDLRRPVALCPTIASPMHRARVSGSYSIAASSDRVAALRVTRISCSSTQVSRTKPRCAPRRRHGRLPFDVLRSPNGRRERTAQTQGGLAPPSGSPWRACATNLLAHGDEALRSARGNG